jgi:hypothetical protein
MRDQVQNLGDLGFEWAGFSDGGHGIPSKSECQPDMAEVQRIQPLKPQVEGKDSAQGGAAHRLALEPMRQAWRGCAATA